MLVLGRPKGSSVNGWKRKVVGIEIVGMDSSLGADWISCVMEKEVESGGKKVEKEC